MDIGQRIKSLRVKKGLTLEELADRSELTKGFLSQLERNLSSPSISTLEDITEVLGISLEDFFKEDRDEKVVFSPNDYFVKENEDGTITWLVPNSQNNEMEPILLTLKSGGESQEIKEHEGEEFAYILQGKLTLVNLVTNEETTLRKGDSFSLKGEFRHKLVNSGDHQAKILWVSTPPLF